MLKRLLIASSLAALATGAPAQTAQAAKEPQSITRADLQKRLAARFAQMDSNRDGSLTRAEVEANRASFMKLTKAVVARELQKDFTASDTDKNGKVTLAELTAAAPAARKASAGKAFERLDSNKDGGVSLAELTAAAPNLKIAGADEFMQRFDADKNGKVTAAEYPRAALAAFDRADSNKDGKISDQERKAGQSKAPSGR